MKPLGKILRLLFLSLNIFFAIMLLLSGYSSIFSPSIFPLLSLLGLAFPAFVVINALFLMLWLLAYPKYCLLPAAALLLCLAPLRDYCPVNFSKKPPEDAIKIISYNVKGFGFAPKSSKLNENSQAISDYLNQSLADVICLQEATGGGKIQDLVNAAMSAYPYQVWSRVKQNVFVCFSKYPILDFKALASGKVNPCVVYRLKLPQKDTLTVINAHLQSNMLSAHDRLYYKQFLLDPEVEKLKGDTSRTVVRKLRASGVVRARQAQMIDSVLKTMDDKYLVVCGDFNDSPLSYTHRVLTRRLIDTHTRSGNGIDYSFNENYLYFRIDNILVNDNLLSYQCNVDRSISASDHYPISCFLSQKRE